MNDTLTSFTRRYRDFLDASPSPFHAAAEAAGMLTSAGFARLDRRASWPTHSGKYFFAEQGAVIAWVLPKTGPEPVEAFSMVAAHTDSPSLKLKPTPQRTTADGWGQLMVEVYGGALLNSWLDRELLIAGQIVDTAGNVHLVRTGPIARIPQLAIHMDREIYSQGLKLDPQDHMQPVWTIDQPDADILAYLAAVAGLPDGRGIAAWDLFFYPSQNAETFGSDNQFIAAGRQDNLSSTFAGLDALIAHASSPASEMAPPVRSIPILALFDHEEIGSQTATGANSSLLPSTLVRIAAGCGVEGAGYQRLLSASTLISADASHSVNPNYPGKHDPDTRPVMGRGPIIKLDADQRYATSAVGDALWQRISAAAGVPAQHFVSVNSLRSGSTVGPMLAAHLAIPTIDVGIPLLSMHSSREMSHGGDIHDLSLALKAFWDMSTTN